MAKKKDTKTAKSAKKSTVKKTDKKVAKPAKAHAKVAKPSKPAAKATKAPAKAPAKVAKAAAKPIKEVPPAKVEAKVKGGKKTKGSATSETPVAAPNVDLPAVPTEEEVVLTNAEGQRYCKVGECDEQSTTDGYCRYHYLLNWKRIQLRKKILAGDKLDRYIEEFTARYPDRFLEIIRKDLVSEKEFLAVIQEMEIDDSGDDAEFEDESRNYIDEVRGVTAATEDDGDF